MQTPPNPLEQRNELLAVRVIEALESRHFEAYYCKTGVDAVSRILALIPEKESVTWDGSMTLEAIGLTKRLYGVTELKCSIISWPLRSRLLFHMKNSLQNSPYDR